MLNVLFVRYRRELFINKSVHFCHSQFFIPCESFSILRKYGINILIFIFRNWIQIMQ